MIGYVRWPLYCSACQSTQIHAHLKGDKAFRCRRCGTVKGRSDASLFKNTCSDDAGGEKDNGNPRNRRQG